MSPMEVLNDDCILEQVIPPSGMSQVEIQENTDNVIIDSEGLEKNNATSPPKKRN